MVQTDKTVDERPLILAVSGGVDSVVMLNKLLASGHRLVIAHFEHGIRGAESQADADFVRRLAQDHRLSYEILSGNLGPQASEEQARNARYEFLRQVAQTYNGILCTAHHADDVIETIAINLQRGTGWRGLAVMSAPDIYRPLLNLTKTEIYNYARQHHLEWREDATNQSDLYLRNRLRKRLQKILKPATKQLLYELYQTQVQLRRAIETEMAQFYQTSGRYQRYFFIMIEANLAQEILWYIIKRQTGLSLTRPQLERALLAIKTAQANDFLVINANLGLKFSLKTFLVKVT